MTRTQDNQGLSVAQAALGKRVRTLRKARRLTQPALARLCKLHASQFGKIENGKENPTFKTLLAIARSLEVSVSELLAAIPPVTDASGDTQENSGSSGDAKQPLSEGLSKAS
jgi:transcriptional regulator with XRE-family HTH domain